MAVNGALPKPACPIITRGGRPFPRPAGAMKTWRAGDVRTVDASVVGIHLRQLSAERVRMASVVAKSRGHGDLNQWAF
jgi:hypothetical protein